jgi:hypothetical protein
MGLISTPLVAETLGDESWYGDGQPTWEHALTSEKAERCRRCCVKRLRRLSKGQPDAGELAAVLDDCKPYNRCMSGACQECSRAPPALVCR